MKKNHRIRWQKLACVAILHVLSLDSCTLWSAETETDAAPITPELERREAVMARRAAERRAAELSARLARTEQELEEMRRRYVRVYLESRALQQELESLDLRVAGLLADGEALSTSRRLALALEALEAQRQAQQALSAKLREFEIYLRSVLDVLQASEVLSREVTARFGGLVAAVERSIQPLSSVAGRGGGVPQPRQYRVLAVNDDLQLVVLDSGFEDGVRPGMRWRVVSRERVVAKLRVIEVRPLISAAVVVEGEFRAIAPGTSVTPGE